MCYPLYCRACKINLICPRKSWFYSRHCYVSMGRMPAYIPPFVKHLWSRNSNLLRITLSLPPGSDLVASSHVSSVSLNCASCFLIIVAWFTISNSLDWLETVKLRRVIFVRAWSGILIIFGIASSENSSPFLKFIASFHFLGQCLNIATHRLWRSLRLYSLRALLLSRHVVWWSGRRPGYQLVTYMTRCYQFNVHDVHRPRYQEQQSYSWETLSTNKQLTI